MRELGISAMLGMVRSGRRGLSDSGSLIRKIKFQLPEILDQKFHPPKPRSYALPPPKTTHPARYFAQKHPSSSLRACRRTRPKSRPSAHSRTSPTARHKKPEDTATATAVEGSMGKMMKTTETKKPELDKTESARLVREGREDDERMTPGPWDTAAERNCPRAVVRAGTEQVADAFNHTHWTDGQCAANAAGIARTRNNLRAMCDALEAAMEEVERLRARMTDVLRSDPRRSISDQRTTQELCDFVCGDVVLFRERCDRLAAEVERLMADLASAEQHADGLRRGQASLAAEVERLTKERDEARNRVLRPLTEGEVVAALHEGHAKRRVAQGDNAWTSLVKERDCLAAEVERLTKERDEALESVEFKEWFSSLRDQVDRGNSVAWAKLVKENNRLSARVRELELTEEEQRAVRYVYDRTSSYSSLGDEHGRMFNLYFAVMDRLLAANRTRGGE